MCTQTRCLSNALEFFNIQVMQNFAAEDKEKVPILAWKGVIAECREVPNQMLHKRKGALIFFKKSKLSRNHVKLNRLSVLNLLRSIVCKDLK